MKVGFCVVNYSELPIEDVVKLAADNGYDAVEIPAYTDNGQVEAEDVIKGSNAEKLRKMVESHGLEISAISNHADSLLVMGPHGVDTDSICAGTPDEKIKFGTESLIKSAQMANALGVESVVAFSGIENYGHINDWPYPGGWADEEKRFAERYLPILDKYKEYGVKLAFEPHPNNFIYDTHTSLRAIELMDEHPCIGINFDPANILFDGLNLATYINALGNRIFTVHAKDCEIVEHNLLKGGLNMQGEWGRLDRSFRFRIPGWGSINWKSVITELYLVGYDGAFNYEHEDVTMSRADGVKKTIAHLKPLMIEAPYEGRNDKLFQR